MGEQKDPEAPSSPDQVVFDEYDEIARDDAKLLLDQVRYLLDDQREYAKKLVDDRKLKLGLAGAFVGLGLFRTSALYSIGTVLEAHWFIATLAVMITILAVVSLVVALFLIVTERDPVTRRVLGWDSNYSETRDPQQGNTENTSDGDIADPRKTFSAALSVLYADDQAIDSLPIECANIQERIVEYRTAFVRLAHANRRVRKRLELGTFFFVTAVMSVILLFGFVVFFGGS